MIAEILLAIIFAVFVLIGFYIIYKQVALVKKGELSYKEILLCIFYGLIFSMAVIIIVAMAFIFAIKSPDLWTMGINPPEKINELVLLIPLSVCLIYISLYPLIDFIYIAISSESKEGLTIFHRILGEKVINRINSKIISLFISLGVYFLIFVVPPLLITLAGVPFIMIWSTWFLVYPLMILTYFGAKGYIAGITNAFIHIPDMKRSIFLGYEDSKRSMDEFIDDPFPYITLGLMLFVFVWQWISMFQTLGFLATGSLAISTYSYSGMVFVTLLFGVVGYFTRFWGRKIQYRGIDVFFAAYLMAAVGINVLVNFLIVNIDKLTETFNSWVFTATIPPNSILFAIPAVIEEIVLITFTSYYFLSRKSEFNINLKFSKINQYAQTFDPVPLFNYLKSSDPEVSKNAQKALIKMYERIPHKVDIDIDHIKIKYQLLDGLCDDDPKVREVSYKIFLMLQDEAPEKIKQWVIEELRSPNYDKSIRIAQSLIETNFSFLKLIPIKLLTELTEDPEWRLKLISLKAISRLIKEVDVGMDNLNIQSLLNDPENKIQVEALNILSKTSYKVPIDLIINKINHPNKKIRASAIKNLKNFKLDEFDSELIPNLIPLMRDPSSLVRAAIFEVLGNLGNFKKYSIPIPPILDGLSSQNPKLREASVFAISKYFKEKPKAIDIKNIINKIDKRDTDSLLSIISVLGNMWRKNEEEILNILLDFIKVDSVDIKSKVSQILVEKTKYDPKLILSELVKIPDVSRFVSKGIISRTLIKMAQSYPDKIIPELIKLSESENKDIQLNVFSALEGLADEYSDQIDIKRILSILKTTSEEGIKKEASKILAKIAKQDPQSIKPVINEFLEVFDEQETSVKITLVKSFSEIAENNPNLISIDSAIQLFSEQDSFIRESAAKMIGKIGALSENYKDAVDALLNEALSDEDWIVREAAINALGKIVAQIKNKDFVIKKLISLLDDEETWVRRSAINLLSEIKELKPSEIPFKIIKNNTQHENENVREATAKLLKRYVEVDIDNIFDEIFDLLEDPSENVRNRMINSMDEIIRQKGITPFLPKLLKHLSDEFSIELQRSIAILLGRTVRYEEEEIKKRVISLLKIRCEMSQDETICGVLHRLTEG
ncbi:MAG: HEAT repeat protein [Promethearchaeota archaeon]|nr:MAG: HEAT repeat protein [Candidatus Lokiarchaeota archaeon]